MELQWLPKKSDIILIKIFLTLDVLEPGRHTEGYEARGEPSNDVFTSTYHKVAYVCGNKSGRRSLSMVCLVSIKNISPTISPSLDVQTQVTNDTRHD